MNCYERMIPKLQEGCGGRIVHIVESPYFGNASGSLHIPIYIHPSSVGGEVQRDLMGISCVGGLVDN